MFTLATIHSTDVSKYMRVTTHQKFILKQIFANNISPDEATRRIVAYKLGISERKVYNWFVSERQKLRSSMGDDYKAIGETIGMQFINEYAIVNDFFM